MRYWIKRWLHRPALKLGPVNRASSQGSRLRNSQFVSFLNAHGSVTQPSFDRHDARLRRRRLVRAFLGLAATTGVLWIAVESAHALTLF